MAVVRYTPPDATARRKVFPRRLQEALDARVPEVKEEGKAQYCSFSKSLLYSPSLPARQGKKEKKYGKNTKIFFTTD
jgi:hypothetical protein